MGSFVHVFRVARFPKPKLHWSKYGIGRVVLRQLSGSFEADLVVLRQYVRLPFAAG